MSSSTSTVSTSPPAHTTTTTSPTTTESTSTSPRTAQVVSLLGELIRNACVNDGTPDSGQEVRNARTLVEFLAGSGAEVELVEPHPGRVSAIFTVRGTDPDAPPLSLIGHTDVVPVDEENWSFEPFAGEVVDGVVRGRGALDMLNLTAAMAVVTREVATSGAPLAGDLVFAAVADEEAGSRFGMDWITTHRPGLVPTENALTESGGLHVGSHVTVTVGEKGGAPRRLVAHGRGGHGSLPWGAANAALLAADAALRVAGHRTRPVLDARWRAFVAASPLSESARAALLDPERLDDALPELGTSARFGHAVSHLTLSPNVLRSGSKGNVIPGRGEVDVDIRLLPGQSGDDADAAVAAALGELAAPAGPVEVLAGPARDASVSPDHGRLYDALVGAVTARFPSSEVLPLLTSGGTDARFVRERGGVAYGFALFSDAWDVGRFRSLFHGDDEQVDVESLRLTVDALSEVVTGFLGPVGATTEAGR